MWFRKSKTQKAPVTYPGIPDVLDGHAAVWAVETMASDAVVVQSGTDLAEITGPLRHLAPAGDQASPAVYRMDDLRPLTAQVSGLAATGVRASALIAGLSGAREALFATAGKRLACVFNLTCRAIRRQAGSLHGGHDDYYATAGSGVFQLFAANVQEAADFALIAHRVAERALTPGVCAQDFYQTSQSAQNIVLPEPELIEEYLGRSEDIIDSPTPAQMVLFGPRRRRVPLMIDRDHPAGIGGTQDGDSYFKALAAQYPFFAAHLDAIIDDALGEFGRLTGREYQKLSGYRVEDARYVILAQGAVTESLEEVIDYVRDKGIEAGVIGLGLFRPFPGAMLSRMLKGKAAVTILERADQPLAEDLPLTREVRSVIDKAVENSGSGGTVHSGYETYKNFSERPRIYSGIYGAGGVLPSFTDLAAVFDNMSGKKEAGHAKLRFYLGAGYSGFSRSARRFPHLQTLQQRLNREYPGLEALTLSTGDDSIIQGPGKREKRADCSSIHLFSPSAQGGVFAGNLFSQAMADTFSRSVRTFPLGGLEPGLQPVCQTLVFADSGEAPKVRPESADTLLLSGEKLLENMSSRVHLARDGAIVVGSTLDPETLWRSLSRGTKEWIRDTQARGVYVVNVNTIASETASQPSFTDQLAVWALLGAGLKLDPGLGEDAVDKFVDILGTRLERLFGDGHYLVKDITTAVRRGGQGLTALELSPRDDEDTRAVEEKVAPWTVHESGDPGDDDMLDSTVFDPARFWRSVGYLYDRGESDKTLTDPYVATGIIPGGSSAYRDMSPHRLGVPRWVPENCTACGECWAHCPDSALPPTIQPVSSIIKTAISLCEKDGDSMIQLQRITDHLAKQAYKIFATDALGQYRTSGPLLREAFTQLVEKMKLGEDKVKPLEEEFVKVCEKVEHYPVARTKKFFDDAHNNEKDSGRVFSIALNPLSCKGCRLCIEVCEDHAFEWVEQTPEYLQTARKNWEWQKKLPAVPREWIEGHIDEHDPKTEVLRLLDGKAYHSMVGGDGAFPGNSTKTAVHLVTAAIESVVRPRFEAYAEKLASLTQKLEDKIQGKISSAVEINDFENFGQELTRIGKKELTFERLARLAGKDSSTSDIDPEQLKFWNELLGHLKNQLRLYREGAGGAGRARMVMTIDPAGAAFWSGTYPDNPHVQPWITHVPGDAPALAEGLYEGIAHLLADEIKVHRLAELVLDDEYDPEKHDAFLEHLGPHNFTDEERELLPAVLVIGHDGVTSWDEISRLVSRRYPIKIAVINTEAVSLPESFDEGYRSGPHEENDPGILGFARRGAYVLQSTVGNPGHLMRGVIEGMSRPCPAVFHIHAPDANQHGIAPEKSAEQARLAYASRAFPLFEAKPGDAGTRATLNLDGNPDPDENWTGQILAFRDQTDKNAPEDGATLNTPLTVADWAIREARFHEHFVLHSPGYMSEKTKPLTEYLSLDGEHRQSYEPFIHVVDEQHRHVIAIPSPAIVRAVEERLRLWMRLRDLAAPGRGLKQDEALAAESGAEAGITGETATPAAAVTDEALFEKLTEKLLWFSGYSQDPDFFKQSLRDFLTRKKAAQPADDNNKTTG